MFIGRSYYILILTATLFTFACLLYLSAAEVGSIPEEAAAGKQVFQSRSCIQCHSLFGNGGYYGGDLTRVYVRLGEVPLKERLIDPPLLVGASSKRHMSLSGAEADLIAKYLHYISLIDTTGWPPSK